jgi:hypothetical protein
MMNLNITKEERELLLEMLEAKAVGMSHEIHHTDSREFREHLKKRRELIEALQEKVEKIASPGASE